MIRVSPFVARAIASWQAWRTKQRLYRALPELRRIDAEERAARHVHRPVRHLQAMRRDLITAELHREVHHG